MKSKKFRYFSEENMIMLTFLDETDVVKSIRAESVRSNLTEFLKIESENSGLLLDESNLFDVPGLITAFIFDQLKKNSSLFIQDNKINIVLYTLTELNNESKTKLFYLWNISTQLIVQTRTEFCYLNNLEIHNCCRRNCLIQFGDEFDSYVKTPQDLDKYCQFPYIFVQPYCSYSSYLLNPENQKEIFNKLPINNQFINTNNIISDKKPIPTQLLSCFTIKQKIDMSSRVEKLANLNSMPNLKELVNIPASLNVSPDIAEKLDELDNNSLLNYNCKHLYKSLSLNDGTFENLLFDCFLTLYSKQISIITNYSRTNLDIKLLACEFFVK